MQVPFVVGIAAVALLVLLRHYAARRVAARQGQFVWLMFVPTLIGGIAFLWAGIQMLAAAPPVGVVSAIAGGIYLTVVLRFLMRLSRSVTSAAPQDDLATAMTEPFVDFVRATMGLVLIAGLVAMVGLIVLGVSLAVR
jgi:hypothetical protein